MAQGPEWNSQSLCFLWIFTLLLSESQTKKTQTYYMKKPDCGISKYVGGATVYSHNRQLSTYFSNNVECQMTFKAENDKWRIMLRVIDLEIPDKKENGICNDGLYIYDSEGIYTKAMSEAGGNFGLCGYELPSTLYSTGPYLTVHFRTDNEGQPGRGFKFIVTAFSEGKKNGSRETTDYEKYQTCGSSFMCDSHFCIDEDLICDTVDHCGDDSDEASDGRAKCGVKVESFINKLGVTAAVTITVGSVIVVVVCIVAVVCCCRRAFCKPAADTSTSTTTTTPNTLVANGTSGYPQTQTNSYISREYLPTHQGYYPMQPVYNPQPQGSLYSAFPREMYTKCNTNSGSGYSSQSHSHSQPPSYHRSYTPTSSRSGKSNRSNNSTSVTFSQETEKITLPTNL